MTRSNAVCNTFGEKCDVAHLENAMGIAVEN